MQVCIKDSLVLCCVLAKTPNPSTAFTLQVASPPCKGHGRCTTAQHRQCPGLHLTYFSGMVLTVDADHHGLCCCSSLLLFAARLMRCMRLLMSWASWCGRRPCLHVHPTPGEQQAARTLLMSWVLITKHRWPLNRALFNARRVLPVHMPFA